MDLPLSPKFREYLKARKDLFTQDSEFSYCSQCNSKCCTDPTQVAINLYDIVNICMETDRTLEDIAGRLRFAIHDSFLRDGNGLQGGIFGVVLELPKPCNFLDGTKCSVYGGRPIVCATYPETRYMDMTDENPEPKNMPDDHPCKAGMTLSQKRKDALFKLMITGMRERIGSDIFLFGMYPTLIDMDKYDTDRGRKIFGEEVLLYCEEMELDPEDFVENMKESPETREIRNRVLNKLPIIKKNLEKARADIVGLEDPIKLKMLEGGLGVANVILSDFGLDMQYRLSREEGIIATHIPKG